jgi:glycosyltransferase involved in cell wall biosynthesis
MPLVTVVMSVFNGRESVIDTIRSIQSDSACEVEIVVVNDGSTDGSAEILDALASEDRRISILHQENCGLTRALARGCASARGKYIARLDCGDRNIKGRFCQQIEALESHPELAFVSCWTRVCTVSGEELFRSAGTGRAREPIGILDLNEISCVIDGPTHHGSVMFSRILYEKVGGYRWQFYYGQDWDLWYRLAEVGKFQMIPEVLYEARVSPGDISMNQKRRQEEIARCSLAAMKLRSLGKSDVVALEAAARIRPTRSQGPRLGNNFRGNYFIGETLRRNGDFASASKYLWEAAKANPFYLKSWLRLCQLAIR